ncbi:hypothetical protein NBE98_09510 [Clostridium swellfunianum]|uniref:hypothetical protein n=1 Tax=Clostridium swellfunianum TaxID=1367462 RepID=UPI00203087FD|nr:hypothetical protein [Clostridium swellfunianum]MCM0648609.1 hypothetical protein [Clostridium swellfunianum]
MKIYGFYVRKDSKKHRVKEISIDVNKALMTASVTVMMLNGMSYTAYAGSITSSVQPIIDVLKDLAEPIAYGFMIKGFMKIMAGDEHEGMKTIKYSVGGYVGIQWIPAIFRLIKGITF